MHPLETQPRFQIRCTTPNGVAEHGLEMYRSPAVRGRRRGPGGQLGTPGCDARRTGPLHDTYWSPAGLPGREVVTPAFSRPLDLEPVGAGRTHRASRGLFLALPVGPRLPARAVAFLLSPAPFAPFSLTSPPPFDLLLSCLVFSFLLFFPSFFSFFFSFPIFALVSHLSQSYTTPPRSFFSFTFCVCEVPFPHPLSVTFQYKPAARVKVPCRHDLPPRSPPPPPVHPQPNPTLSR